MKKTCWSNRRPSGQFRSRGQIGAGTIVILIAVLIVAATTAGVLFNVTGILQSQAGATGDTVGAEAESPIRVAAVTGRVDQTTTPSVLNRTRVVVALDATTAVDLDEATVQLETSVGHDTLVYGPDGPVEGERYAIDPLVDSKNTAPTLTRSSDRFAIVIETPSLSPDDRLMVRISLESGATETVRVRIPEQIETESAVTLR